MRNKKYLILVIISLAILSGMGVSYAYWRFTTSQSSRNIGITRCLKLSITNESNEINLDNLYPISDEEGKSLTPYSFTITNTCSMSADYSLNLEVLEGSTLNSKYLDVLVNNEDIKLLSNYDTTSTVISNSVESRTLDRNILTPGASKDYQISFWMDKDVTINDDAMNKVFKSKVVINATATHTVVDDIVASLDTTGKCPTVNSDGTVNVTSAEQENSLLCSAPDDYGMSYYYRGNVTNNYVKFGKWSNDAEDIVVGYNKDGFVNTYNSLSNCENDNTYNINCTLIKRAGKDMYWRIVRINGDGSIRLIYDGTAAYENGYASGDRVLAKGAFNSKYDDNAYVGYMYGNLDGIAENKGFVQVNTLSKDANIYIAKEYEFNESTKSFALKNPILISVKDLHDDYIGYYSIYSANATSSSVLNKIYGIELGDSVVKIKTGFLWYGTTSKEQAQSNVNSSTIKTYLDNWYKNNILGTEYKQYLADNIFCNDRTVSGKTTYGVIYTNNGYGREPTIYRWFYGPWSKNDGDNLYTRLYCQEKNDAFTVNDTLKGNGALIYPISLLTADEAVMAGSYTGLSKIENYLYTGFGFHTWLLSPNRFDSGNYAVETVIGSNGTIGYGWYNNSYRGIKPVINIRPDALKSGDGTIDNPYTVE